MAFDTPCPKHFHMNQVNQVGFERKSYRLHPLTQFLVNLSIITGITLIVIGIDQLNSLTDQIFRAYMFLTIGSCALIFLPAQARLATPPLTLYFILLLAASICVSMQNNIFQILQRAAPIAWERFSSQWLISIASFITIFVAWQKLRKRDAQRIERVDILCASAVLLVAFAVRAWSVVTRSPIGIEDEVQVFSAVLSTGGYVNINPLTTLNAFPAFYHWVISYIYSPFYDVVDLFVFQKILVALAGAASISLWYMILLHFRGRSAALVASSLLCFLGWHWLNSRFLYCYPYDLAFSAAGILCSLIALRNQSVFHAMLSGMFCALTLVFQKAGVMVCPLIAYIFLEALIRRDKIQRREKLLLASIWILSIVFFYMPFIVYGVSPSNPEGLFPRQSGVLATRAAELVRLRIGEFEALRLMVIDLFLQLQRLEFDHVRHLFRLHGPILDPVLSGLFFLGLVKVVVSTLKDSGARICLVGFIVFSLPMIISFPIDSGSEHGLSRRFLGSSPFVAWMGAVGADLLVRRFLAPRFHAAALVLLCCLSAYGNFFYLMRDYLGANNPADISAHKDLAIQRSSSALLVRNLAKSGFRVVYYWDSRPLAGALSTKGLRSLTQDLPNVIHVDTIEELRNQILLSKSAPQFVVIPAATAFMDKLYQDMPTQIGDIIPSHVWMPGPTDTRMIPTSWYAFVRATN